MLRDTVIVDDSAETRTHKIFNALYEICLEFDLGKPIWLDANVSEMRRTSKVRFRQDSFIENIDFDYLELQVIEVTRSDVEKIEKEIEERKLVKRPELIEAVKEARAQGDLSENFEYYAAKREKNLNESRIRYLERMLKFATIVEEKESADDEAALNKTVTVYFPDDDETETFRIVTSIRGNSLKGLISIDSPMGKALLHRRGGDTVYVKVNERAGYNVVIKEIGEVLDDTDDAIRQY